MDKVNDRLEDIEFENNVWYIYLIIILLSLYSNKLERRFLIYNDNNSKSIYRKIIIFIFLILNIIYMLFFISSLDDYNNLKSSDSSKYKYLTFLSLIASSLVMISGIIYIYIAIVDEDASIEIAFN